jgi:hypothetical protein
MTGYVDRTTPARRRHILDGDATGGGHRWPGLPGKTPFPRDWSDDKIIHEISEVAVDPASIRAPTRGGRTIISGTRNGVDLRVIVDAIGAILTGFPPTSRETHEGPNERRTLR